MEKNEIKEEIIKIFSNEKITIYNFSVESLIFEESVKLKCFQCENYNVKHTCPPKINIFDYKKIFSEKQNALVVKVEYTVSNQDEFNLVRRTSTNYLHKTLLEIEKFFWKNNESMVLTFIGGSCKLCKECDEKKCRNPYSARIPWEATGVNIVKTLKQALGIEVDFSSEDTLCRYGLVVW